MEAEIAHELHLPDQAMDFAKELAEGKNIEFQFTETDFDYQIEEAMHLSA